MYRFMPEVERVLRRAGWFPGRQVEIDAWKRSLPDFAWHVAGEEFLREFGGIRVDIDMLGVMRAGEPFEIDPELAVGEEGRFAELSERFSRKFFPLGEIGQGEFFLAIDEEGIIYLLAAWAFRVGKREGALENLINGASPERVIPR